MLSFPSAVRIYLCREKTDMRKSFDGLSGMVREIIGADPLSGHLFVFRNRRCDSLKILYWDRDGFAIWYKRLEKGTFKLPSGNHGDMTITHRDLAMLLEGVDFKSIRRRPRYSLT